MFSVSGGPGSDRDGSAWPRQRPGSAGADPEERRVLCNYTMSDPQVVDVSGTQMVTATITPSGVQRFREPDALRRSA